MPPRQPRIYVLGAVEESGYFDVDRPVSIVQALAMAGGRTPQANRTRVAVLRVENEEYVLRVIDAPGFVDPRKGAARPAYLQPDDVVFVPQSRLASAADVASQLQQLLLLNGFSASVSYRAGDVNLD